MPFAEKEPLPPRRNLPNAFTHDIVQLRRKWIAVSVSGLFSLLLIVALFTPVRHHMQEPLRKIDFFHTSRPVPEGVWDGWENLDKIYALYAQLSGVGRKIVLIGRC